MKNKVKFFLSLLILFGCSAVATSTIAWFKNGNDVSFGGDQNDMVKVKSGVLSGYYGGGKGTSADPYIISSKTHLYNLAWLQYLGTYNGSPVNQLYFKVTADIDMNGITLPPIGTSQYPFLGNFNGNGKTISNLTVSNAFADYGTAHPTSVSSDNFTQPQIVGFFGVVGQLPTPAITYSSSIVSLTNFTLEDITVKSNTTNTLIGLAAGYVNLDKVAASTSETPIEGTINGIKVGGEAKLDLGDSTKQAIPNFVTSNLSDYGLVGYTTMKGTAGTFTQKLSEYYDNIDMNTTAGSDWGGSLNFYEFTQRIHYLVHQTSQNNAPPYKYSDNYNKVSYRYQSNTGNYNTNPSGLKTTYNLNVNTVMPFSVYWEDEFVSFKSTSSYLKGNLVEYNNLYYECSVDSVDPGTFDDTQWTQVYLNRPKSTNTGYIIGQGSESSSQGSSYVKIASSPEGFLRASLMKGATEDSTYSNCFQYMEILTPISPGVAPSSSATSNFCVVRDSYNSAAIGTLENTPTANVPLPTNGGSLNGFTIKTQAELGFAKTKKYSKSRKMLHETLSKASFVQGLRFDSSTTVSTGNSVLVSNPFVTQINGSNLTSSSNSQYRFPSGCVNFKLKESGYINFYGGNYKNDGKGAGTFFGLYTVSRPTTNTNTTLSAINRIGEIWTNTNANTKDTYPYLYYQCSSNNYTSNTATTPAGTLIARGYSSSNVTPGKKVFDDRYLTSTLTANALYYYEIPVNSGEFCIGGIGSAGGYLVYLDIGASEVPNVDHITAYSVTTVKTGNSYPTGVDFAVNNATGIGGQSLGVFVETSSSGSITFDVVVTKNDSNVVTENYISITDANSLAHYAFKGSLHLGDPPEPPDTDYFYVTGKKPINAVEPSSGGTRVLTINITPVNSDVTTVVTIVDILEEETIGTDINYTFDESESTYYYTDGTNTGNTRAEVLALSAQMSEELLDETLRQLHLAATFVRSGLTGNEFSVSYLEDSPYCDYSDQTIDVSVSANGESLSVSVSDGYGLYIDGVEFTGNTYP